MAEIRRVIVPKSTLPEINADTEQYVVRFRVVSEDRNRQSHWSAQYLVGLEPAEIVESNIVTVGTGFITVTWDPEDTSSLHDIYVAWGFTNTTSVGTPEYFGTLAGNVATIAIPSGALAVKAYVQRVSYPKGTIAPSAIIAESSVTEL